MIERSEESSWAEALTQLLRAFDLGGEGSAAADPLLWKQVVARVALIARHQLRGSDAEDDVVQNVLIRLRSPTVLKTLRDVRYPAAYIARMVHNEAIDRQRRVLRHEPLTLDVMAEMNDVDKEIEFRRLDEVRRTLKTDERSLLEARFFRGLTIAEIAAEHGERYSTIAKRLFRLLAKLRAAVGERHG
jgi:RNA polymerase sigma factor (sigma-70 family)